MGCPRLLLPALLSLATALAAISHAAAETYKWIDDKGMVQYTDRLPPDLSRGMTELNKQGMTTKVTEPALTAEQRKAKEEALEQERQAERAKRYKRYQDDALLSSYSTENDIDLARRRNLALVGDSINSAEARISALEKRRASLQREALFHETKPVPERLKRELASVIAEIPKQHALIEQKNQEALEVINRYEERKARYRELKAQMARDALAVKRQ